MTNKEQPTCEFAFIKDMAKIITLINEGAPLSQFHIPGKTDILLEAIVNKKIIIFNNMLNRGFNIVEGEFLYLHHTVRTEELRYVKEITSRVIDNKEYLNKIDTATGDNALHVATKSIIDSSIILNLSEVGVNWNVKNNIGQTPLHYLLRNYLIIDKEIVDELINKKVNFNLKDKMGISPLDIIKSFKLNKEWEDDECNQYLLENIKLLLEQEEE